MPDVWEYRSEGHLDHNSEILRRQDLIISDRLQPIVSHCVASTLRARLERGSESREILEVLDEALSRVCRRIPQENIRVVVKFEAYYPEPHILPIIRMELKMPSYPIPPPPDSVRFRALFHVEGRWSPSYISRVAGRPGPGGIIELYPFFDEAHRLLPYYAIVW